MTTNVLNQCRSIVALMSVKDEEEETLVLSDSTYRCETKTVKINNAQGYKISSDCFDSALKTKPRRKKELKNESTAK